MKTLQLDLPGDPRLGLCGMARSLVGSEILRIAAEIRAKKQRGETICDLTVGDFASKEFPIPDKLRDGVVRALAAGETNYPPSDGVLKLREAVRDFYRARLVAEMAPYVVHVDGISKAFAATGLRVGWSVGPPAVIAAMKDLLGHVGAWAPRAEQVATAELLRDEAELQRYGVQLRANLQAR